MLTQIIISHTSIEALKTSKLWTEIMAQMFAPGDLSVTEITALDTTGEADQRPTAAGAGAPDATEGSQHE